MTILINQDTRVLVQGITGSVGAFQTKIMLEYGTKLVAGVTPSKGGTLFEGIPVFNDVEKAVAETAPNAAICFVPAKFARDAALEVIQTAIPLLVLTTEGVPEKDMLNSCLCSDQRHENRWTRHTGNYFSWGQQIGRTSRADVPKGNRGPGF